MHTQALLRKSGVLPLNLRVLVLAPKALDARTIARLLREAVVRFKALCRHMESFSLGWVNIISAGTSS